MTSSTWLLIAAVSSVLIYIILGVPLFKDPLRVTFKKDSRHAQDIIEKTRLSTMVFTTCLAGTFPYFQMVGMLILEAFYHATYPAIPLHREIIKYRDGGEAAIDWAYAVP